MTENPCVESGCQASCCGNIRGRTEGSADKFKQAFPTAQSVATIDELSQKVRNREQGVFYSEKGGTTYFTVSGACPNLLPNNDCRIHEKRYYPQACMNMVMGSVDCQQARDLFVINARVSEHLDR